MDNKRLISDAAWFAAIKACAKDCSDNDEAITYTVLWDELKNYRAGSLKRTLKSISKLGGRITDDGYVVFD